MRELRMQTLQKKVVIVQSLATLILGLMITTDVVAQANVEVAKFLDYKQPVKPMGADNYQYSTYYFNGHKSYNLKGFTLGSASHDIISLKYNPAGTAYALLSRTSKKGVVEIFDPWKIDKDLFTLKYESLPTAICYSANSRRFFVADNSNTVKVFETRQYTRTAQWSLSLTASKLVASPNDYYLAAAGGSSVVVINQETGGIRVTLSSLGAVTDVAFSEDSQLLGVLSSDGRLVVYDTRSFQITSEFTMLGSAQSLSFHPDGKYVAVLTSDKEITFVNLMDKNDRSVLRDVEGGATYLRFLKDGNQKVYLSYNALKSVKYRVLKGLSPNMRKLLVTELNARMEEWAKMQPGETLEAYQNRVNEETRLQQARLFEQEIATELAGDLLMQATISLGTYNAETNMLTLGFSNMPQIYLTVPQNEVASFSDVNNLEFSDVVYGMTMDDRFEMTYAKVHNKVTGKTYEFNNLERRSLDFLTTDDNFVPIELVQQSIMEDFKLQGIMDEVVKDAKQRSEISDHTHITVGTSVVAANDADGRKITNYKVNFNYTVEESYSVRDDFAAGKYKIEQSKAISMLKIVTQAFQQDFAQYLKPGKKLIVKVTGSADALKINGTIGYDGCYGDFTDEPYYLNNGLNAMTVTSQTGIKSNEQLAFMRAVGVKDYVAHNIPSLGNMQTDYQYHIEVADKAGSQYRRINLEFTFVDAFN